MSLTLTTADDHDRWLTVPVESAPKLQRLLPIWLV